MSIIGNPTFRVRFNLSSTPVLVLTDTTSTPPSGMEGYFFITQPDGITTTSPAVGPAGSYNHTLRLDSSGGVQIGTYTIAFSAPDYYTETFTRTFYFDYLPVLLRPTENFNPFTPYLGYIDNTNYSVPGYTTNSVTRSWSISSTPTGTITSALPSLDLIYNGSYWAANYTGTFSATISYTNSTYSWLTITEGLSVAVSSCVSNLKTLAEMTDKVNDLLNGNDNCDNTNEAFEKGQTLVGHFVDQLRLQQVANISQPDIFDTYKKVVSYLWNSYSCQPDNQELVAYDFADYVNSSIYTDSAAFGFLVGNDVDLTFTVNHNLNTDYPVVQIYDAITKVQLTSGYEVTIVSRNTVSVTFDSVPSTNQYIVIVHSGADHLKGREVQLQVDGDYIQWKYDTDVTWTNLVALEDITPKIDVGTTTAVEYDQLPTVTNSGDTYNVVLDFEIPKGVPVQIRSSGGYIQWKYASDVDWTNIVSYTDINATVDVGTVSVLNPDQSPTVQNSGTTSDAILDFELPRAPEVSVGTVSTVNPEDGASVVNSGSNGDVVLDFEIPKGDKGDAGTPIEMRYDSGYLQWKYEDEVSWTNLIDINSAYISLTLGTVTTVNPDQNPSITNSGTPSAAIFNFSLPRAAAVSVGTTTTGNPGTSASVSDSGTNGDSVLDFTIPRGADGITIVSDTAPSSPIAGTQWFNSITGESYIWYDSYWVQDCNSTVFKGDKGDTGATGSAATVSVGTVTTGAAGSSASVSNGGTSSAAVLNFTIPRGDTGTAATVAVGSTTTGGAGTSASVTNAGTSSAAVLNFTIPKGDTGATGPSNPSSTLFSYYNFI